MVQSPLLFLYVGDTAFFQDFFKGFLICLRTADNKQFAVVAVDRCGVVCIGECGELELGIIHIALKAALFAKSLNLLNVLKSCKT